MEALKAFPRTDTKLYTKKGTAVCQKIDIFQGFLWYAYEGEWMNWFKITAEQANKIIQSNKNKEDVASLEEFEVQLLETEKQPDFNNVVGQDSLTRFDKPKGKKPRGKSRKKKRKGKPSKNA